jgi:hypothetical protein
MGRVPPVGGPFGSIDDEDQQYYQEDEDEEDNADSNQD